MDPVKVLHVITEPTRFELLKLLFEHHYCVKALSKKLGISEPAVSQHMRLLKKYSIVQGVKIGFQVHYQVDVNLVSSILNELLQWFSQYPPTIQITKDWDCVCEYSSQCIKRDSKTLEEQGYGQ